MNKRIGILTLGSRGDVQPYIALGAALQARGHSVTVATFESFKRMVEGQGIQHVPVPGDAQALTGQMMGGDGISSRNPLRLMQKIRETFGKAMADYARAFGASELLDSEVILDQLPGGIFGRDIAEKSGAQYLTVAVIPLLRTRYFPNPLLAAKNLGAPLNVMSYRLAETLLWAFFRKGVGQFRTQIGLGAPTRFFKAAKAPVLLGISPNVVPPPSDWPKNVHLTGYWQLNETAWQPPSDLQAFISAGDPPVFIGFGSMSSGDPARLTNIVFEAIRLSGVRAVIGAGWAKWGDLAQHDRIFRVDYAPYAWLFPKMAAIVHHGGSGTTGFALHSGVPSMVLAFGADQPFWGWRTANLGVGVPPLHIKSVTADTLADSLRRLVSESALKANAAALGRQLAQERGLEQAVSVIDSYIN